LQYKCKKSYPIVEVLWIDACSEGGWGDGSPAEATKTMVQTVGYLTGTSKKHPKLHLSTIKVKKGKGRRHLAELKGKGSGLTMITSNTTEGGFNHKFTIPHAWILKVRTLGYATILVEDE